MSPIADMHCDTLSYLETPASIGSSLRESKGQLDLSRMQRAGYCLQNFAIFVDTKEYPQAWERAVCLADRFELEMERNKDMVRQVRTWGDIQKNCAEGLLSALLTLEEGAVCEGSFEKLQEMYDRGVRMMTLTWNHANDLGMPASPAKPEKIGKVRGLTQRGIEFVRRMEELGMIPDVSHLSDQGFWELADETKKPFVASHSNARSLCGHPRNLTDDMIRCIGQRGGCIGLNFYQSFLCEKQEQLSEAFAAHAKHIMKCGGEEVLGLGSDFDGIPLNPVLQGAQDMPKLWEILHGVGFTSRQLDLIFGENVLRVYREILDA